MTDAPLMPKATAVWLVENTSLSFDQIADFCKLHPLEVKGIADGEVATGIKGHDPITSGQLTPRGNRRGRERPVASFAAGAIQGSAAGSQTRPWAALYAAFTPPGPSQRDPLALAQPPGIEGRADHAPRRTTKTTLQAIRNRTHWNSAALTPMDPVTLGLCSQMDLDFEVNRAAKERTPVEEDRKQTLVPAEITTAPRPEGQHDGDVFSHRPRDAARGRPFRRRVRFRQTQSLSQGLRLAA